MSDERTPIEIIDNILTEYEGRISELEKKLRIRTDNQHDTDIRILNLTGNLEEKIAELEKKYGDVLLSRGIMDEQTKKEIEKLEKSIINFKEELRDGLIKKDNEISELKENITTIVDSSGNFEDMLLSMINKNKEVLRESIDFSNLLLELFFQAGILDKENHQRAYKEIKKLLAKLDVGSARQTEKKEFKCFSCKHHSTHSGTWCANIIGMCLMFEKFEAIETDYMRMCQECKFIASYFTEEPCRSCQSYRDFPTIKPSWEKKEVPKGFTKKE